MVTGKRSQPLLAHVRQVRAYGGQPFQCIKRLLPAAVFAFIDYSGCFGIVAQALCEKEGSDDVARQVFHGR
ncbi:MAG: hypothetical protein ACYSR9_11800 [Planctomycetota bacterium]